MNDLRKAAPRSGPATNWSPPRRPGAQRQNVPRIAIEGSRSPEVDPPRPTLYDHLAAAGCHFSQTSGPIGCFEMTISSRYR